MSNKQSNRLIVKNKPGSYISEAYWMLKKNIELLSLDPGKKINTIMVSSVIPQRGIDIIIANFALTIAESGKKVIIVDCNLRKPQLHEVFGSDSKPGLTNMLVVDIKVSEIIRKADEINSNLSYIPAGPIPHNPSRLLGSEKMKTVIGELRKSADIVIFNTAPIIGFVDSLELAHQVDGVILILNAGMVTQEAAKQAKVLLEKVKANILGVVLSNVNTKQIDYYRY